MRAALLVKIRQKMAEIEMEKEEKRCYTKDK